MNPYDYQRNLPHLLPPGETVFITFRLANSLPETVLNQLREDYAAPDSETREESYARRKRYFGKFDALLDKSVSGPLWLREPAIAKVMLEALRFFEGPAYELVCFCVMPNHVHLVATLVEKGTPMVRSLQSIKSFTAREANKLLNRNGQFWHRESYDHVVRSQQELRNIISYTLENPARAGLVDDWQQWPYSFWQQ